jgi:hypothetical protein
VRPILTYAALLWWKKTTQSSVNQKIGSLQHLACICVTGSIRSPLSSALEVLLMLPPLNIFIEKDCIQAAYRLKCTGRLNRDKVGHSEILTRMTEENLLLLVPSDKIEPTNVFGRAFSVEISHRTYWLGSVLPPNSVTFYTDGSLLNFTYYSRELRKLTCSYVKRYVLIVEPHSCRNSLLTIE